jgi:membrane-associated phospholipid phosphatase
LLLLLACSMVQAAPPEPQQPYWRRNLFRRFLEDQKILLTSWWPAESQRASFSVPLGVALAAGLSDADSRAIPSGAGGQDVAEAFSRLGDTESAIVLVGGTYLLSRWTGNRRLERATSLSSEALMSAALYSTLLKRVTRRTRPVAGGTGEFFVGQLEAGQSSASFPSGHAMGAFSVAAVISHEYQDRAWAPWLAYGTASLIALSRVKLERHYPADVLAGAVVGLSIGRMVARRDIDGGDRWPARLQPAIDPGHGVVTLSYRRSW